MDSDFVRLPNNTTDFPVESKDGTLFDWLKPEHDGDSIYDLLGVTLKQVPNSDQTYIHMDPGDAIHLLATYQWALHAGRHDLAASFVDAYKEFRCADDYSSFLDIQEKVLRCDNQRNFFTRSFDAQLCITLAYTVKEYESQHGDLAERKELINLIVEKCCSPASRKEGNGTSVEAISDRIESEWKQTKQEPPEGHDFLRNLIRKCKSATELGHDIQCSSLDDVVGVIIYKAETALAIPDCNPRKEDFVETWPLLTVVPVFAQTVFGALGCAARHFNETPGINLELQKLTMRIHQMLCDFRSRFDDVYQTDFMLAPLFAANIALAGTIRLYDKAHIWLGDLLRDAALINSKVSRHFAGTMMPYSDMLWSQMIQLRGALPKKLHTSSLVIPSNESLPNELTEDSRAIENALENLNVYPCHVVMRNDIAITKFMNELKDIATPDAEIMKSNFLRMHDYLQRVPSSASKHAEKIELSLKGQLLPLSDCYKPTSSLKYSIPQSILLCGQILESLNLSQTGLEQLHPTFGTHFPNLTYLDLSENKLSSLPTSIGRLASLQSLIIDHNCLESLPIFRLNHLRHLGANANKLKTIPETIGECSELRTVDLSGNQLDYSKFVSIMTKLPNLTSFKPEKKPLKSSIKRSNSNVTDYRQRKKVRFLNP